MISSKSVGANPIQTERVGANSDDKFQRQSALAKEAFDGKDIGTVLNEIADPNWVDPAKRRKVGSNELDKDAFMKLMLEQMKNQDPTNPLKSHEMAAQLAQFTSLEQLQNMNSGIQKLVSAQSPNEKYQALAMVGKVISSDSSVLSHSKGQEEHEIRFDLPKAAKEAKVTISDKQGNQIRTYDLNNLKEGTNSITWNAKDEEGYDAAAGEYLIGIIAKGEDGQSIIANTKVAGRITGVNFGPEGPVLMVGKQTVKLQDVKTIEDSSVLKKSSDNQQTDATKAEGANKPDLKKADNQEENKGMRPLGNLDQVAMQKDLKDKLKKVGADGNQ